MGAFASELADEQHCMCESDPCVEKGLLAGLTSEVVSDTLSELVIDAELELALCPHA